jgi:hypothetical protein
MRAESLVKPWIPLLLRTPGQPLRLRGSTQLRKRSAHSAGRPKGLAHRIKVDDHE